MPLAFRLAAFYFAFFVHVSLLVAYFPPYLAARGLGPAEIGWVLALPQMARIVAPGAWGWLADRTGAQRAVVIWASAVNVACFALLPQMGDFAAIAWLMGATSLVSSAALPLVEAITLGALVGQSGRYGVIRVWGSIGFIVAVLGGGAWLERYAVQNLPFALLAFALATLGAALVLPALFRRYALSTLLMASAGCAVLRFLLIGWAADWLALLVAAQLLHAATFGSFHAASVAAVQRVFPAHAQARGQALFSSASNGAGGALGALAAGWAWQEGGPGIAFTLSSIAALAGLFFAYPLRRAGL